MRGEAWSVEGVRKIHPTYGAELVAACCRYELPRGRLIVDYLALSANFPGIGEAKARRLWDFFGDELADVLGRGDLTALCQVLTVRVARGLVEAWAERKAEAMVVEFLDTHGFEPNLATAVRRAWGNDAARMMELNPYYLLAFTSWAPVDAAAAKLGVAHDDPRRLIGAVESCLYDRLSDGHTITDEATLIRCINRLLVRACGGHALKLAVEEGAVVGSAEAGYQSIGAAAMEQAVVARIRSMLAGDLSFLEEIGTRTRQPDFIASAVERIQAVHGFRLSEEQIEAVRLPFESQFSILCGGAGVGKTTVLGAIADLAVAMGFDVMPMALSGRATKRIEEGSGHAAMTIARFIAAVSVDQLKHLSSRAIVIVDEASMLDLPTTYRILRCLSDGVRVLFVGDPTQLPPIGFGLVFHRLVNNPRVPFVELSTVLRQSAVTGIPKVAEDVRHHRLPSLAPFSGVQPGVSFIECGLDEIVQQLRIVATCWEGEDWRILSALKVGRAGVRAINDAFHFDRCSRVERQPNFEVGEPVVHRVNDYTRSLMNGSLGQVTARDEFGGTVIDFDGQQFTFRPEELRGRIELAYAISVHKAQGSQFKRVAIAIQQSRVLDHSLVYTALTRGVEQVVFVGARAPFESAVLNSAFAQRRSVAFDV
ncbi:AAA family ATPase [Paraburkholderia sp. JPY169]|uniref:AAA family ATPase n=2 Tax=Paraburkholderia youngii TaxID=2782701 RepID=A0A7Y6JUA6_9BURK|nr:AAA family ATPase [Paraburkholderia youngii]